MMCCFEKLFLLTGVLLLMTSSVKAEDHPSILIAAGDIASCESQGDEMTADLIGSLLEKYPQATIASLGDTVYNIGSYQEFMNCFDPSWGRYKKYIRPSVGNHEYKTEGASGYFGYFGAAAGDPNKGWYSYDQGKWHIVVLNTGECEDYPELCAKGSPQVQWLRADLSMHRNQCTLAYFHHPMFTSGKHHEEGGFLKKIWEYAMIYGVDVILNGHDHGYERLAPMNDEGVLDDLRGIRQFVIGTGGVNLTPFSDARKEQNSMVRIDTSYGVIVFSLKENSYLWEFQSAPSGKILDYGAGECHK